MWGMSLAHWAIVVGVIVVLFGRNFVTRFMVDVIGGMKKARQAFAEIEAEDPNKPK